MKYSESPNKNKKAVNTGLYVTIALCLLIVGGAAWFALSSSNQAESKTPSDTSNNNQVYSDKQSSYNENNNDSYMEPPVISSNMSTPAAESVSSEPYASQNSDSSQITAFIMPVQGDIIKKHSDKELQFSATYGDMRLHNGVDIAASIGTSVSACCDGVIEKIELNTGYGNIITIDHKNGITVKYASLDNLKVEEGDSVKAGDIIGTVGSVPAECMDKEHLHLEVLKNGKSVSPLEALGLE